MRRDAAVHRELARIFDELQRVKHTPAPGGNTAAQFSVKPVADITGREFGDGPLPDQRRAAVRHLLDVVRAGGPYINRHTGHEIRVGRLGSKKMTSSAADPIRLGLARHVPALIEQGSLVRSEQNRVDQNIRAYHYFDAPVHVRGTPRLVTFTVFEDGNGRWYYNHDFATVDEKKNPPVYPAPSASEDAAGGPAIGGSRDSTLTAPQSDEPPAKRAGHGSRGTQADTATPEGSMSPPGNEVARGVPGLTSPDGEASGESTPPTEQRFALRPPTRYTPGMVGPETRTAAQRPEQTAAAVRDNLHRLRRLRREGKAAAQMLSWRGAIEELASALNPRPPLRNRRAMRGKALGYYTPSLQTINLDRPDNLRTFVHEVGHYLNDLLFPAMKTHGRIALLVFPKSWRKEMVDLGKALYGTRQPTGGYAR